MAESPKLPPMSVRACEDSEPETCSPPADSLPSMPSPMTPSTATTLIHAVKTAHGCVMARRVSAGAARRPRMAAAWCYPLKAKRWQLPCRRARFIGVGRMDELGL